MIQEAMPNASMLCFVLQFSVSTVIDALQCFKKGDRRYSLVSAHVNMRCAGTSQPLADPGVGRFWQPSRPPLASSVPALWWGWLMALLERKGKEGLYNSFEPLSPFPGFDVRRVSSA
eukprot:1157840-Pelagomonas_calceolata.AAC.3